MISFLSNLSQAFKSYFNEENDAELCQLNDQKWNLTVDAFEVFRLLKHLKLKQSPGYDGIPARLLRESS